MGPAAPAAAALHLDLDRRRRCRCHHRIHAPLPLPPLPLLLLTTAAILLGRGLLGAHAFGIAPTGTSALSSIRTRAGRTGAAAAASIVAMSAASTKSKSTDERVVVIGGGIIGASVLYQLSLKGYKPVLLERAEVAAAASGKSGGFLARSWTDSGPTRALHRLSYDMHAQLARDLGVASYRRIPTLSVQGGVKRGSKGKGPSWLDGDARSEVMDEDTAQVTPKELTTKMVEAAKARGAEVVIGTAAGVEFHAAADDDGATDGGEQRRVAGVRVEGQAAAIPCEKVVVAMGPWVPVAGAWFDVPLPMEGIYSTSITLRDCAPVQAEPFALFCAEDRNNCHLEVYPRPDGSVYVCGLGRSDYVSGARLLPGGDCDRPEKVVPNPKRVEAAMRSLTGMAPSLTQGKEPEAACCMRPCPPDGVPIIGRIPGAANAFVAGGSNCWGILGAPATGLVTAELVAGEAPSVALDAFSPARFMPSAARRGKKIRGMEVGEQW